MAQAVHATGRTGLSLPRHQGGEVGRVLDDGAPLEGPGVPGDLLAAVQHAHELGRSQRGQRPPDPVMRHAVFIAVDADVGRGADLDLDAVVRGEGVVGQGLPPPALVSPGLAHGQRGVVRVLSLGDGALVHRSRMRPFSLPR